MTELTKALVARFTTPALPLYLAGWVPADAPMPYLTMTLEVADWRRLGYMALTVWCPAAADGNEARFAALDRLAGQVPPGGLRVPYPGGVCIVRRARADFLRLVSEPQRSQAIGGQARFEIVRYPAGSVREVIA